MPAVLNASNEIAVQSFLKGEIGFLDIPGVIRKTMDQHAREEIASLEDVLRADKWARDCAVEVSSFSKSIGFTGL